MLLTLQSSLYSHLSAQAFTSLIENPLKQEKIVPFSAMFSGQSNYLLTMLTFLGISFCTSE